MAFKIPLALFVFHFVSLGNYKITASSAACQVCHFLNTGNEINLKSTKNGLLNTRNFVLINSEEFKRASKNHAHVDHLFFVPLHSQAASATSHPSSLSLQNVATNVCLSLCSSDSACPFLCPLVSVSFHQAFFSVTHYLKKCSVL